MVKGCEIKGRGEAHCTKLTWTQEECGGGDDEGRDGRWRAGNDIHVNLLPTQRDRMLPTRGGGCGPSHDAKLTAEQKKTSRGMVDLMNQSLRSRMRSGKGTSVPSQKTPEQHTKVWLGGRQQDPEDVICGFVFFFVGHRLTGPVWASSA